MNILQLDTKHQILIRYLGISAGAETSLSIAASAGEVVEFPGFDDITYMQDMTDHKCYIAEVGETKQLIDSRDGKKYWVSKLADGNCWMVQNLALDLSTSRTLTPNDTDIPTNWTPSDDTQTGEPSFSGETNALTVSYTPGAYVYSTPTQQNICTNTSSFANCIGLYGWKDVADYTASDAIMSGSVVNEVTKTYDARYLSGNYYTVLASTAGQGTDDFIGSQKSYPSSFTQSICPRGWRLPSSGNTGEFFNLYYSYGWRPTRTNDDGMRWGGAVSGKTYDMRTSPVYLVYSGAIHGSVFSTLGGNSQLQSSTIFDTNKFIVSNVDASINPSYTTPYLKSGFSVRCIAR